MNDDKLRLLWAQATDSSSVESLTIRRFAPPLKLEEAAILGAAPYEDPICVRGTKYIKLCRKLCRCGLLEQNPGSTQFRVTETGAEVLRLWRKAGFPV